MELYSSLELSSAILTIGAYQGIMAGILLWLRKGNNQLANRMLGLLLVGMGMAVMNRMLIFSPVILDYPFLFRWTGLLSFGYGPVIYFYIRSYISRDFAFNRIHLWHALPLLLAILIQWFFADQFQMSPLVWRERILSCIIPPLSYRILGGATLLHVISYLFFSVQMIRRYRILVQDSTATADQVRRRWVSWIMVVLLVPLLFGLFGIIVFGKGESLPIPAFAACIMIFIVYFLYLMRPEILDGIPPDLQVAEADLSTPRYESSTLSETQKQKYHRALLDLMQQAMPYRNQDLTLSDLAERLSVHPKYLSQTINELSEQSFTDFINGYRIREAQHLLRSPRHQHFTIVAIAQEVGFNSRSAFYTAFKKITGRTPTEFKKGSRSSGS